MEADTATPKSSDTQSRKEVYYFASISRAVIDTATLGTESSHSYNDDDDKYRLYITLRYINRFESEL